MYCNNCGSSNPDQAKWCGNCGASLGQQPASPSVTAQQPPPDVFQPAGPRIESYLVHSLLVTLFCCLPLGIPAIVYAASVSNKVSVGDIAGAMEASRKAKMWCWIAAITGVVFGFGWLGLAFLGGLGNLH